jgi:hypothetical protein
LAARKFGIRELGRLALWGVATAGALATVAYASSTNAGRERVKVAVSDIREALLPTGVQVQHPLTAQEGQRLVEAVRTLTADREQLLTRIAALEHNVEDITGSIARVQQTQKNAESAARIPEPAPSPQLEAAAPPTQPPEEVTSTITMPAQTQPLQQPTRDTPVSIRTEFGLDLGSAPTVEALRGAWAIALRRHGKLLEGLYPVVHRRERPRGAGLELRLVAGPLPNAAAAARICAAMTAVSAICQPSIFEGQRLAQH